MELALSHKGLALPAAPTLQKRIDSIDILRGIVMVIMALDHTRDFFHITANIDDPLNLQTTTPLLFFTRWITHFCAPIFVFLSGVSIYLQSLRKTKKELSLFLLKRGFWLVFAEVVIVAFGLTFNPFYNFILLQVIWAIGLSMIILSLLIRLPMAVLLTIGLVIVVGHNSLDFPEQAAGFKSNLFWDLVHRGGAIFFGKTHIAAILYPFLPWTGLMIVGYCTGRFFTPDYTPAQRQKILATIGFGLLVMFVVVRFINRYGDPFPWSHQRNGLYTFLSFIKVQKYPPSLMYMCMTIGPALLMLAMLENLRNGFTNVMRIYGRTAFFYYLIHFYLIHLLCAIAFFAKGHSMQEALDSVNKLPFLFVLPGEGFSLGVVYLVWAFVVISLYPFCKKYDGYKTLHRDKWWLSYL
ncbi:MAG: heparan-alpha-glucosaminide N-acetyltransferase domain-containing protein [Chitinophagaceae bacterium]